MSCAQFKIDRSANCWRKLLGLAAEALGRRIGPIGLAVLLGAGCQSLRPSNDRDWAPDMARLAYAEFHGDQVTVRNIRNCRYMDADTFVLDWYDKTFNLNQVDSVDLIVVPFAGAPRLAHVMLSFGFQQEDYLCLSVEIRRERHESYSAVNGFLNGYELMYVLGDERDLIQLRANHRLDDVYVYRTRTSPEQARALLIDVLQRANQLTVEPEFYNTLTNNCTTNVVAHVNRVAPGTIPYGLGVLLPGKSPKLAYNLGLLEGGESFIETRQRARINRLVYIHRDAPDFSRKIRQ
jgi:hypothetical protein